MSLSKIPFIVASLVGAHTTYTHSQPPPLEYKRRLEKKSLRPLVAFTKAIVWALGLVELAAIAANTPTVRRALPVSQRVLGMLFPAQNADQLRIVPEAAFGALLALCGGAIRTACYRRMGQHFSSDLAIQKDHKLITSGPYSIVRHPGYTSALMAFVGLSVFHAAPGSFLRESRVWNTNLGRLCASLIIAMILFPASLVRHRIQLEDAALRSEFGRDWDEWVRKVPYRLVPGVY